MACLPCFPHSLLALLLFISKVITQHQQTFLFPKFHVLLGTPHELKIPNPCLQVRTQILACRFSPAVSSWQPHYLGCHLPHGSGEEDYVAFFHTPPPFPPQRSVQQGVFSCNTSNKQQSVSKKLLLLYQIKSLILNPSLQAILFRPCRDVV